MALESAKLGASVGQFLGPEGELGGAVIGGVLGAAGVLGNLLPRRTPPSQPHERLPLLVRPSPLQGRTLTPSSGLRQRTPAPVPGREPDTEATATAAINRAVQQSRRPPTFRPRARHIPPVVGIAGAAAATANAALTSQIPQPPSTAPIPPTPPTVTTPSAPQPPPVTPTIPQSPPIDEPPVIIDPNNPDQELPPENETKQPEIPPEVISEHFSNVDRRNQRVGNFRLPVYGRHNFVQWTRYTEGNAVNSAY